MSGIRPPRRGATRLSERAVGHARSLHVQFLLFCMVGLGNVAVDATVFALLVAGLGWRDGLEPLAASVLGFVAGATHSFIWNSRVTFRFGRAADSPALVGQFLSVAAGGAVLSAIAFSVVGALWPDPVTTLVASKLGAIGIATLWNFSLMRGWVFSHRRRGLAAEGGLVPSSSSEPA